MKAEKYYFATIDSEVCYESSCFGKGTEVYEAIPVRWKGVFWCRQYLFCGDDSRDSCGKQCKAYVPRNGKNGCCKYYTTKLYEHGNKVILK
jgi:hypothetical protein